MWQQIVRSSSVVRQVMQRSPWLLKLGCMAPLLLVGTTVLPPLAADAGNPATLISLKFPDSEGDAPRRTAGAGVRGAPACITTHPDQTLVALMPNDRVSLTAAGQPSFFVFIPPNTAPEGVFELYLDEEHSGSYVEHITLSGDPGLIEVTIPPEIALQTDRDYFWRFSLVCDNRSPENNAIVQGNVQRIELTASQEAELKQITPGTLAEAQFYAENGIWHEATAILYDIQADSPQQWSEWLGSVNLEFLMDNPEDLFSSPKLF